MNDCWLIDCESWEAIAIIQVVVFALAAIYWFWRHGRPRGPLD